MVFQMGIYQELFSFLEEEFIWYVSITARHDVDNFAIGYDGIPVILSKDFISLETKISSCCNLCKYIAFEFRLNNI